MGFMTGNTAVHDLTEGQRRFLLGQAMDLNTLVWVVGICLVVQQHHDGHVLLLRAESNGQGAAEPQLTQVEESELLYCLKQHAVDELQAQHVFATLATYEDAAGMEDALSTD